MKPQFISILAALVLAVSCASDGAIVTSPDGNLEICVSPSDGQLGFSIVYKGETLVENAAAGLEFADGYFGKDLRIRAGKVTRIIDDYDMPIGKASHIHSESNACIVKLSDASGRCVEMHIRTFDDAVAYRWVIPEQKSMSELAIRSETMDLKTVGDPVMKGMVLPGFKCSHEGLYETKALSEFEDGLYIDMPAILKFPSGKFIAVTEAMIVDYAGMMLSTQDGGLKGILSPRLDDSGLCVTGDLPHRSPWRVFMAADRDGALLESTVLTTLADPCTETDLSWLKPGLATWPWWNGYQAPEGMKKGDINTVNQNVFRHYIDFCADNGIPYHSITGIIDENDNEICWYFNEGSHPGDPGENDDTSRPFPGFDMASLCKYAQSKGIDMRVWVHWKTFDKNMEETFKQYSEWGVKGMMVDFMDRDDQEMMQYEEKVLRMAMKYHMHIQFHGASKPCGLQRTYPCEFTREGTFNYETYKWTAGYKDEISGAGHDLSVSFTRSLAGPTDYHLGSFRAVRSEDFKPVHLRPVTTCTRSHSLALYVVYESALHLVSDAPEAYVGQEGFEFLKKVPTVWDETRVIDAKMDEYIVVARRKGADWYIGCIGDAKGRVLNLKTDFLGEGDWNLTLWQDTEESATDLNSIRRVGTAISAGSVLDINLAPSGGFAGIISPSCQN